MGCLKARSRNSPNWHENVRLYPILSLSHTTILVVREWFDIIFETSIFD